MSRPKEPCPNCGDPFSPMACRFCRKRGSFLGVVMDRLKQCHYCHASLYHTVPGPDGRPVLDPEGKP